MIKVMGGAVGGEKQGMRLGMERGSAHLDHASINRRLRREERRELLGVGVGHGQLAVGGGLLDALGLGLLLDRDGARLAAGSRPIAAAPPLGSRHCWAGSRYGCALLRGADDDFFIFLTKKWQGSHQIRI